jgi:hypothetical protein
MNEIRTSCKRKHWHKECFFDKDIKIEIFLIIEPPSLISKIKTQNQPVIEKS